MNSLTFPLEQIMDIVSKNIIAFGVAIMVLTISEPTC